MNANDGCRDAARPRGGPLALRRAVSAALLAALASLLLAGLVRTGPAAADPPLKNQAISIMSATYGQFMSFKRSSLRNPRFDWSSDGCSWTPLPWSWEHRAPCEQHDFGYRNFGKGLRLERTESRRAWIDRRFLSEMLRNCRDHWWYPNCATGAWTMYGVVRNFSNWRD